MRPMLAVNYVVAPRGCVAATASWACVLPRAVMSACPSFYYCQRLGAEVSLVVGHRPKPEPELLMTRIGGSGERVRPLVRN